MPIEITHRTETRLAVVRHLGPYTQISRAFEELGQRAGAAGLLGSEPAQMIGIYYDDPDSTPAERLRADAGVVVPEDARIPSTLTERRLPAGTYACTVHVGSYEHLGDTYRRLFGEWIPASGKRPDGPSHERYLNMPGQVPAEELRTEICVPVV